MVVLFLSSAATGLYDPDKRLLFVHIPKTGGDSVDKAIMEWHRNASNMTLASSNVMTGVPRTPFFPAGVDKSQEREEALRIKCGSGTLNLQLWNATHLPYVKALWGEPTHHIFPAVALQSFLMRF